MQIGLYAGGDIILLHILRDLYSFWVWYRIFSCGYCGYKNYIKSKVMNDANLLEMARKVILTVSLNKGMYFM